MLQQTWEGGGEQTSHVRVKDFDVLFSFSLREKFSLIYLNLTKKKHHNDANM